MLHHGLNRIIKPLVSLRLAIVCLALAMVLVFVGTLGQVDIGTYEAQKKYFQSWFLYWSPAGGLHIPVFPGGFLIGTVLLANLIATHLERFKMSWKKSGIFLTHFGLILLLLGGLFTALLAKESHMRLSEGTSKNYSESSDYYELAIVDKSAKDHDQVVAIPDAILESKSVVETPGLPFTVKIVKLFPNAAVERAAEKTKASGATRGIGENVAVSEIPVTHKMDERNMPAALVELVANGKSLGTWLVSILLGAEQKFSFGGKDYTIQLRDTRYYRPYRVALEKFTHEKYAGTEVPKNFASNLRLTDPERGENRDVLIYMNHPLRYRGETFYQGGFDEHDPHVSILQVVRNPSWLMPYVSCSLMGLGLIVQFLIHLFKFFNRRLA
jgi:hypothetical protein